MSKIFLSHSSSDNFEALALAFPLIPGETRFFRHNVNLFL